MAKILFVDDSRFLRSLMREVMKNAGHELLEADGGYSAYQILKTVDDIDLIICDVNMPGMDGVTLSKRIHQSSSIKKIPILFLTAGTSEEKLQEAKNYGVVGLISKPFNESIVLTSIKNILKNS